MGLKSTVAPNPYFFVLPFFRVFVILLALSPSAGNDSSDLAGAFLTSLGEKAIIFAFLWAKTAWHGLMNSNHCIAKQHGVTQSRGRLAETGIGTASYT